jgi:ribosomal protein S18 acetylase RimI-like enzyme
MGVTYFKRYRMEISLRKAVFKVPPPPGYALIPWSPELFESHVDVKFGSFKRELDTLVFSSFRTRDGCRLVMERITRNKGFLPSATWLAVRKGKGGRGLFCGTIQGVCNPNGFGGIQNIGVLPQERGKGVGTALIHKALTGFQRAGMKAAYLEVTAENESAVLLYEKLGFQIARIQYKESADLF